MVSILKNVSIRTKKFETVELGLKSSGVLKLLANKLPRKGSMLAWRKSETYCDSGF